MVIATEATAKRDTYRPFNMIEIYGHSWTTPQGVTGATSWWAMLAHSLGVGVIRRGLSGTRITQASNGQGGWDRILNAHKRLPVAAPLPRLAILMQGLKFAGFGVATATFLAVMRTAIRRLQASAVVEETDSGFTYTGTWTPASSNACSGGAYTYITATGGTIAFTAPAWVPAGSLLVLRSTHDAAATTPFAATNGGAFSITKNGANQAAWTISAAGTLGTTIMPDSYELTVNPGDTVQLTASTVTTQLRFDGYDIVPPTPQPVLVALPSRARPAAYFTYNGANPSGTQAIMEALVRDYNVQLAALCATLGVPTFDLERALNQDPEYFLSDNLHPTSMAQIPIARAAIEALGLTARREVGTPAPYGEDLIQTAQLAKTASFSPTAGQTAGGYSGFSKVRQSTWMFNVTAVSGTTPSLTLRIVGFNPYDGTWHTVATAPAPVTAVGPVAITVPGGTPDILAPAGDITGTTPSFTFDVIETHQALGSA